MIKLLDSWLLYMYIWVEHDTLSVYCKINHQINVLASFCPLFWQITKFILFIIVPLIKEPVSWGNIKIALLHNDFRFNLWYLLLFVYQNHSECHYFNNSFMFVIFHVHTRYSFPVIYIMRNFFRTFLYNFESFNITV